MRPVLFCVMAPFLLGPLAACNKDGGGDLTPAALLVSPETLDFGAVEQGATSTLEVTLSNSGGDAVDILSVSLLEGENSLWSVDKNGVEAVLGGATAVVLVSFAPSATGAEAGRVQIRSSDAENASAFVALVGEGALSTADGDGDGYSPADGDCDDADPARNPGAAEVCDGLDTDCDGTLPADEDDDDFDGIPICGGDCNDEDEGVYPGAPEICDGQDNDCVGGLTEDQDGDGDGFTPCDGDCEDAAPAVFPGAVESCDGLDNDCDGGVDDLDADGDGHTVCSASGDCDDNDPNAYPVVVADYGSPNGQGTDADPFDTVATAYANLDQICHEINVLPGSYEADLTVDGDFLTVRGTAGAADLVFSPPQYGERLFHVSNGGVLVLQNLTLTGGSSLSDGGAVRVDTGAALTLRSVVADGNTSSQDGGVIAVSSASLTLQNGCSFTNNSASDDGGAISATSPVLFSDRGSSYVNNTAGNAGAVSVFGGTVEMSDTWFEGNNATLGDGGALQISGGGSYEVERGTLQLNSASGAGGAIALTDIADADGFVRNLRVLDNAAGTNGGGIAVNGSSAAIQIFNNTLTGNGAGGDGGGLYVGVVNAGGVRAQGNVVAWSDADSGLFLAVGSGAVVNFNTSFATNSLVDFAGGVLVDTNENYSRDPLFVALSDDGFPGNDDLDLQGASPEIDSGPPDAALNDLDGTPNDRGATGGPGAP